MRAGLLILLAVVCCILVLPGAAWARLPVVAAENVYGDVAGQIGGPDVRVVSIISSPDADPHLFEASPAVARAIAAARIVVVNGAGYDPWMTRLLSASAAAGQDVIVVADIARRTAGDNPHLWYDPTIMAGFARALSTGLARRDPAHSAEYGRRLQTYLASLAPIEAKIAAMRGRFGGQSVTATEPVFGYMAAALGLVMRNERFQRAVMNDAEPSAADVAAFEDDLRHRRVRALLYNSQATDPSATRLLTIAEQAKVPVVAVTETEPAGKTYQAWMTGQLDALARALAQAPR